MVLLATVTTDACIFPLIFNLSLLFIIGFIFWPFQRYIRLSHELNGNWYAWSSDPNSYAMMWRYHHFSQVPPFSFPLFPSLSNSLISHRYVYNKVMGGTGFTKSHVQWVFEPVSPYEPDANHDFRLYWPGMLLIHLYRYSFPSFLVFI